MSRNAQFRKLPVGMVAIGPAAKEAVPALTEALKDEEVKVGNAAKATLKKIKAEK